MWLKECIIKNFFIRYKVHRKKFYGIGMYQYSCFVKNIVQVQKMQKISQPEIGHMIITAYKAFHVEINFTST